MDDQASAYSVIKLTSLERPIDRFVNATIQPIEQRGSELTLISVVEISNRWNPAIEIGTGIPQTFVRAFNRSQNRSTLTKFEDSLKAVNQFLEANKEKLSELVNCALAILSEDNLYFSTINNGHLLLWRGGKLSQITGTGLADESFATVTSGELQRGDWLIGASEELRALVKNADQATWKKEPKPTILRQLVEIANPDDRSKLTGVFVELDDRPSSQTIEVGELESRLPIQLPKIGFSAARLTSFYQTALGKVKPLFSDVQSRVATLLAHRNQSDKPPDAEPGAENIIDYPRRPFPYRRLILPIIFVAVLVAGILLVRAEFKRVGKAPTVSVPTIAELVTKTAAKDMFAFVEQNLTVDNYKNLTDGQRVTFTKALAAQHIDLVGDSNKVATLPNPIAALDNTAGNLYAIDSTGQLWKGQTQLAKVTQASLVQNPVSLAALADNKVLISDQAGAIWLFDGSSSQPINLPLPTALTQDQKLLQKFGSSNLYIYSVANQAIYKVGGFTHDIVPTGSTTTPAADGTIPPPPPWIASNVLNFGAFDDWTVPGDFVGAVANGTIKNFLKNKTENLSIQYYTDANRLRISLTGTDNQLAVARGKFVSTYSTTDGTKLSEKALITTNFITDLSPGPNKTFWVAAGATLYKL